ncbi:MAG: hypothetical protein ABI467_20365 [Kofleriaceae bacterium]
MKHGGHRRLAPRTVAPYFWLVALVHAASVATLFDRVAAALPAPVPLAIMSAQVPLLVLSGYFEGQLDYGPSRIGVPRPVKLAFTFAFIYIAAVTLQTLHFSIGPLDPTPPLAFPPAQRALWFAMFTAGMFFPFYLAASGGLIPVMRGLTRPLRALPRLAGALAALGLGGVVGLGVFALATEIQLGAFVDRIQDAIRVSPGLAVGAALGMTVVPMILGVVLERDGPEE